MRVGFEGTEVARPYVPAPPNFAIKPTVEKVEILRSSEDFRLSDAATVPCWAATFEDRISEVFRNDQRIIDRRGRMTDGRRQSRESGERVSIGRNRRHPPIDPSAWEGFFACLDNRPAGFQNGKVR